MMLEIERSTPEPKDLEQEEKTYVKNTSTPDNSTLAEDPSLSLRDIENNAQDASDSASSTGSVPETFIVGWDDGDNDPLCPRSFGTARKWAMVFIVCLTTLCV